MEEKPMFFRFLSKLSARFAYAGLIVNVGKALTRSFSGMAHNGCALTIKRKLSETVSFACRFCRFATEVPGTRHNSSAPSPAPCASWAPGSGRAVVPCLNGGCVKGAFPLVFICPLHIKIFFI